MIMNGRWIARVLIALVIGALPASAGYAEPARLWPEVKSWVYQLENVDLDVIASSKAELAVIDYSTDGTGATALTRKKIESIKKKPDGARRYIVAYMSVGEAEDYRWYWKEAWRTHKPAWLDEENPDWKGNFKVRYWDKDWQNIIFHYLDKIIAAGFDGVYLDIIDAFEYYEDSRPAAARDMINFVRSIRERALKSAGGDAFAIIVQNGERLLEYPSYVNLIDGISKEDLYFGLQKDGRPNDPAAVAEAQTLLAIAVRSGKLVTVVEYGLDQDAFREVTDRARRRGYIPLVTTRELDRFPKGMTTHGRLDQERRSGTMQAQRLGKVNLGQFGKGGFFFSVSTEITTEKYRYDSTDYEPDDWDWDVSDFPEKSFKADIYYEWTTSFAVYYGITDAMRVGVAAPVVLRRLEKDGDDTISALSDTSAHTGLGKVTLSLDHYKELGEGAWSLLTTLEVALPTDRSDDPFFPGETEAYFNLYGDRFWDRVGALWNAGLDYFEEGSGYVAKYGAGVEYQPNRRWYLSGVIGGNYVVTSRDDIEDRNIVSLEGNIQYSTDDQKLLALGVTIDMNGGAKTRSAFLEFSF